MYISIIIFSVEGIQIIINISISNKPSRNGKAVKFLHHCCVHQDWHHHWVDSQGDYTLFLGAKEELTDVEVIDNSKSLNLFSILLQLKLIVEVDDVEDGFVVEEYTDFKGNTLL